MFFIIIIIIIIIIIWNEQKIRKTEYFSKKAEIFHYRLGKNTKTYEIVFCYQWKKGKLNIYLVIGQVAKTIAELELGSRRGQPGARRFMGKKSNFGKWKFLT